MTKKKYQPLRYVVETQVEFWAKTAKDYRERSKDRSLEDYERGLYAGCAIAYESAVSRLADALESQDEWDARWADDEDGEVE